jgi:hypothetical protein
MNDITLKVATAGGLFSAFALTHFFVDFVFQSHSEAMVKHINPHIRAKHCLIYTSAFIPWMYVLDFTFLEWYISLYVLFFSHFYLDTYHLVYLWAKYIRRPPEMTEPSVKKFYDESFNEKVSFAKPDPKEGFKKFADTILGKILLIAIDQISHLIFLIVMVICAMN